MGSGDFSILLRQGLHACVEAYRSSSLYHRSLGFFFVGIAGGSVWGTQQRKADEARNADCASVHVAFYELPPEANAKGDQQTQQKQKQAQLPTTPKRRFEQLWGEAARGMQRQSGYTYTLMFRRVTSALEALELESQRQAEVEQAQGSRRGVGPGLGLPADKGSRQGPQATDYVEMRVWESDALRKKAQALQSPLLQKMQALGVGLSGGRYTRVFDDALVRLIQ